jgi:hypothetical protein
MKPERVQAVYDELDKYVIELDPDPSARGPAYLQDLISKTRGSLNQVSRLIQEVHRHRHSQEIELDKLATAYELSSDHLLATDGRVTRLPNIDDRKAMIGFILLDERTKILGLQREIKELGFVDKAVRHRHKELDNTMSAIRMQKSLIDTEMRTGAFYGDENDNSRKRTMGVKAAAAETSGFGGYGVDDIDAEEFAKLVAAASNTPVPEEEDDTLSQLLGETLTPVAAPVLSTPEETPEGTPQQLVGTPENATNVEEGDPAEDEQKMNDFLDDDEFAGVFDELDETSV